ncbi:MAG: aldo/keto reductase [Bacteroidetes bacterium]|nr:aldo/keto reductase [Bacteroidota bacterium]MCL5025644.1 aldo/keto reductase [Chloroflexota bacterium]
MKYRPFGRTGFQVSAISLGTEYLINRTREHVAGVVHEAIERGVNYLDLFFAQPEFRDNMGAAFRGCRHQVMLAAHLGAIDVDGQSDKTRDPTLAEAFFHDFLARYHTEYVDVLYLHNIDAQEDYDRVMALGGLLELALRLQGEGKARAIGFSGHTVATARQAVESGQIDVLMFPINLTGHAVPGRKELFQACASRRVGLVAMKPFAGGKLLRQERTLSMENWQRGGAPMELERKLPITPIQCLAYVLSQPGLSTVVPGCKDREELAAAQAFWGASPEEKDFAPALVDFAQYSAGDCVYCNHCLPCPAAIDIGQTIRLLEAASGRPTPDLVAAYAALPSPASECTGCGACTERCPFGVDAAARIEQAAALFERPA